MLVYVMRSYITLKRVDEQRSEKFDLNKFFVSICPTPATLTPLNEIPVVYFGVTKKNFKAKLENIKKCIRKNFLYFEETELSSSKIKKNRYMEIKLSSPKVKKVLILTPKKLSLYFTNILCF